MKEEFNQKFEQFVSKYNHDIEMIGLKHRHSYRVANLSEMIAKSIGLEKEDIYLAYVIGLLHDIGRFKQVEDYDSTDDKYMDHGSLGSYILFDENLIVEFYKEEKNYQIIKKAVENHNKKDLLESNNEREVLFAKIIRDADKLDIFYLSATKEIIFQNKGLKATPVVWENFSKYQAIDYKDMNTLADQVLLFFALTFNLNFFVSFEYLKEKNYINLIINIYQYNYSFDLEKVKKQLNDYIDKKMAELKI